MILDRRAVEAHDDVARPHAGHVSIRTLLHAEYDHSLGVGCAKLFGKPRRERLQGDAADRAALDFAVLDEFVHDMAGEVARHREPDALIAAGLAENRGVDAD